MISIKFTKNMTKSQFQNPHHIVAAFIITLFLAHLFNCSVNAAHEPPSEQATAYRPPKPVCKNWIELGSKCFKIFHKPTNYEAAKGRCSDNGGQLAYIEDESNKEQETSSDRGSSNSNNILSYLATAERKSDVRLAYYVSISAELAKEHQERQQSGFYSDGSSGDPYDSHTDTDLSISEMWLPRGDPSLANITATSIPDKQDNTHNAFVLAYSKHYKRWGLVPVAPIKKMSFICEVKSNSAQRSSQPTSLVQPSASSVVPHHQIIEPKRASDSHSQSPQASTTSQVNGNHQSHENSSRNLSPSSFSSNSRRTNQETREQPTTQPPDSASMLFRDVPQDHSVRLGSTGELRCSALESESSLVWTFNGKNLTTSNRIRSFLNGTLRIEHVRNNDDGNYTCTIHSGGMTESKSARLEILEKPHQPEYITAELLDKLSTSVRIKWTPGFNGNSPIIKYFVEMRTVSSDNIDSDMQTLMEQNTWEPAKANISADQTSVIIPDLKPAKKYIFRIKATNKIGTSEASMPTKPPIEVPVQPPTEAPEKLVGTSRSSTSITIQWSPPPPDSHNGPLKHYKIRYKLAGYASDSDWHYPDVLDAAHLSATLDDLIVWQNYEIQVAAENDKGTGPFSSSVYVRTKEGKPDRSPRNINVEALNSTMIKVNWSPPPAQHINGQNLGYRVQVWLDNERNQLAKEISVPHNIASPSHSIIIDSLLPYTEYHVTVKCFTSDGDGPANEDDIMVKTKQDYPNAVSILEFADVLDKSLKVLWKAPNRINGELDHYTLEYSETLMNDKRIVKKYPASTNEAQIVDLIPQTSYTFKIYPHTNVGPGPAKVNQTTTSVPPVLPEAPNNLAITQVSPYSVTVQFNPGFDGNASIEKWVAEALTPGRGGDSTPKWHTLYVSTNHTQDNSVVVRNLRPFTRYRLRLRPVNVVGPSQSPSEPSPEFQTSQVEPEQPPRDLTIEDIKSTSVLAHWSPLANNLWLGNPRGYNLTWSDSNNSTVMYYLINDTRADSCIVRDLEEFTQYSFRIYSLNEAGLSPPSEAVIISTLEDPPTAGPTNLTAHPLSSSSISVDWNTIPKKHRNGLVKGYKIQYQAMKPNAPIQHKVVDDNSTKHVTINDLKPFTTYHLAVAGFTAAGDGVYSSVLNVQTLEDTPGTPQNLSYPTVSQTSARILWDPPEEANGDILGYKVSYHALTEGSKEIASQELHQNDRTFKATNLKPETHYVFTVTAKTKEGWGQQASTILYTYDSELRANLPFYKESWFTILCACLSVVITVVITALLFVQSKSYQYKQDAIKSTSQDRLGEAGFTIDDDPASHYNNGFGLLTQSGHHRRSNGALSQSTANFTLPKTPPRPYPGSVVYSDDGDDDVFEEVATKPVKSIAGTSNYDSSGDSLTEKPSEISSSTAPESESLDDDYVNTVDKQFVNHYANVNGTLRGQKAWKKGVKHYSSHRTKPKLPQRPVPSVPKVPGQQSSSGSDSNTAANGPTPGTSGLQSLRPSNSVYGESVTFSGKNSKQSDPVSQSGPSQSEATYETNHNTSTTNHALNTTNNRDNQQMDLLNSHMINLNGGRIIVDNMAGSRAPLPGFTSFV